MARIYAGVLGPLAFLTSIAHGVNHGRALDHVLLTAWGCLLIFAFVGSVIGWIAGRVIEDSVNSVIAQEIAEETKSEKSEHLEPPPPKL